MENSIQDTPTDGVDEQQLLDALHAQAEQGKANAQYALGMIYANGQGVDLNYREAARWLALAAAQEYTPAQRVLAWLHANGYGVDQDLEQTRHWYLRAAANGDAEAQLVAGTLYHFGQYGAQKDPAQMLHWYQQAANQGHPKAQFALGKLLAAGELVEANDEAAFQWLSLAALHGHEPAGKELALLSARLDADTLEAYKQRMMAAMQGG